MSKLPRSFYARSTLILARDLLGKILVRNKNGAITAGEITETEAYTAHDPASHSYNGPTKRSAPMFGPPGHAYVYFVYGMYHCFNVVSERDGQAGAVLIRALKPMRGITAMRRRVAAAAGRGADPCAGPGKLCLAMDIDKRLNEADLLGSDLYILDRPKITPNNIKKTPRVGIIEAKSKLWRFVIR